MGLIATQHVRATYRSLLPKFQIRASVVNVDPRLHHYGDDACDDQRPIAKQVLQPPSTLVQRELQRLVLGF